jgi:RimJ/RimL family protein N-acetyltransferase
MIDLPLRTARLELRAFTLDDAPAAHAIYGDAEVMDHVGDDRWRTSPRLRRCYATKSLIRSLGFSFWAVIEGAGGALIGDAGLYCSRATGPKSRSATRSGEPEGRGYATRRRGRA